MREFVQDWVKYPTVHPVMKYHSLLFKILYSIMTKVVTLSAETSDLGVVVEEQDDTSTDAAVLLETNGN